MARLADLRNADKVDRLLSRSPEDADGIGLAIARGRRALVHDRPDEALRSLVRAQSLVRADDPLAVGRIAFLLGAIHLGRGEEVAADAVLAWAEGLLGRRADANADILHLRAVMAEGRGERDASMALYRRVLERASAALTPMTRALAMRNLAATLAHSQPRDSVGLYATSLAVLEAEELDVALRPAIDNGMGYALLCAGDVEGARLKLEQALAEARAAGSARIALFATFNLSIASELGGDLAGAAERLRAVAAEAARLGLAELVGWTRIRLAWLRLLTGSSSEAAASLRAAFPEAPLAEHRESVATLGALTRLAARPAASRAEIASLARSYGRRGDALMEFTLALWAAYADAVGGREAAARRGVARACALGASRGFRASTSWWSPEVVTVAREHAPPELADFAERLLLVAAPRRRERDAEVLLSREGAVTVDGGPLDEAAWRQGRSGSGVLRRYFRALVTAHPATLARDALADLLWPESEGDKAIRNLYTATKDLRRVLAAMPGVRLRVDEGRYGLAVAPTVRVR